MFQNTDQFTYLGSTITINLSFDIEINKRIAVMILQLSKRVGKQGTDFEHHTQSIPDRENKELTLNTILEVYQTCVIGSLLYGSETYTTYARQEDRLGSFYLRNI
jgi:hypothetical protein